MDTKLTYRDPADLRLHPLQKLLPEPEKQSPEWLSFLDGWMSAGVENMPALVITRDGFIMEGGRRWRAAKQLQWESVPTIERPESEAAALIIQSLFGQRPWKMDTKVYVGLPLFPDFAKAGEHRRLENLKRGHKNGQKPLIFPKLSATNSESLKDFCATLGIKTDTFYRAVRVRELFEKHPHFKTEYEADLLSGEKSLWNVESAIKGALGDQSQREPAKENNQLELFTDGLDALAKAAKFWNRFDSAKKDSVRLAWRVTLKAMPLELRAALRTELEKMS